MCFYSVRLLTVLGSTARIPCCSRAVVTWTVLSQGPCSKVCLRYFAGAVTGGVPAYLSAGGRMR